MEERRWRRKEEEKGRERMREWVGEKLGGGRRKEIEEGWRGDVWP